MLLIGVTKCYCGLSVQEVQPARFEPLSSCKNNPENKNNFGGVEKEGCSVQQEHRLHTWMALGETPLHSFIVRGCQWQRALGESLTRHVM